MYYNHEVSTPVQEVREMELHAAAEWANLLEGAIIASANDVLFVGEKNALFFNYS